jgi:hypothetical protein
MLLLLVCVQEFFLPGSLFAVESLHTVRGERRTINFHSAARLDGLVCREELLGKKLIERFTGRDDRLEYRSATFGMSLSSSGAATAVGGGANLAADGFGADGRPQQQLGLLGEAAAGGAAGAAAAAGAGGQDRALPILKMTEKFGRNADKPADEDVAKRVFYLDQGKTMLCFQHGEGRLTAGYLVFHKDGQAQAVQVRLLLLCLIFNVQCLGLATPCSHDLCNEMNACVSECVQACWRESIAAWLHCFTSVQLCVLSSAANLAPCLSCMVVSLPATLLVAQP